MEDCYFASKDIPPPPDVPSIEHRPDCAAVPNVRLLLTLEGGQITRSEVVEPDKHLLTVAGYRELLKRAGYLVIHQDDLLKKLSAD